MSQCRRATKLAKIRGGRKQQSVSVSSGEQVAIGEPIPFVDRRWQIGSWRLSFAVNRSTMPCMNAEAIQSMLRIKPFIPFEVHLSDGSVHEVRHPENAVILKTNLFIGFPEKDSFALCALSHITETRPLQRA